jgi:hypothetical protein
MILGRVPRLRQAKVPFLPLVTRRSRSAFGGSLSQFSALAFGRDAFGGGLFPIALRMNAEIAP